MSYEADPRHAELLAESTGSTYGAGKKRQAFAPCTKDYLEEEAANNIMMHEAEAAPHVLSLREHHRRGMQPGPDGKRELNTAPPMPRAC